MPDVSDTAVYPHVEVLPDPVRRPACRPVKLSDADVLATALVYKAARLINLRSLS